MTVTALPHVPQHGNDVGDWERPIPLQDHSTPPPFPIDVLPSWLSDFVAALAVTTETPTDLAGTMALGALATVGGGRVFVKVNSDWVEPTNLYTAVALGPANRKSSVVSAITGPIREAEKAAIERAAATIRNTHIAHEVADAKAKELTRRASTASANGDADAAIKLREAQEAQQRADEIVIPAAPRFLVDDATTESLASIMAQQHGRISLIQAEAGVFDIIAGRYSGGIATFDLYLKAHSAEEYRVDRKNRDPEIIERACLTMSLAIQPIVLQDIYAKHGFVGRGLIPRFLFVMPKSPVGSRDCDPDTMPLTVRDTYETEIKTLLSSVVEWEKTTALTFEEPAKVVLLQSAAH